MIRHLDNCFFHCNFLSWLSWSSIPLQLQMEFSVCLHNTTNHKNMDFTLYIIFAPSWSSWLPAGATVASCCPQLDQLGYLWTRQWNRLTPSFWLMFLLHTRCGIGRISLTIFPFCPINQIGVDKLSWELRLKLWLGEYQINDEVFAK